MDEVKEGWGWPQRCNKAHYFVDGRALCGRWVFLGDVELGNDNSPDNCAPCKRELEKRQQSKACGSEESI